MTASGAAPPLDRFRHEALLYAGESEFVDAIGDFVADGVAAGEPVLVIVGAHKVDRLRSVLGRDADAVRFVDMAEVGTNPARIIPAWRELVAEGSASDAPFRGVGEPIWAGRPHAELIECQRHESLLNVAFDGAPAWWLLCPYDTEALDPSVIDEARRAHPLVTEEGCTHPSALWAGIEAWPERLDEPLPPPPCDAGAVTFDAAGLESVRQHIASEACRLGLEPERIGDLVVAVNEVVSNSVRHGGGGGTLQLWRDDHTMVCEVRDRGHIADPLVGRHPPSRGLEGGRGLWLVNQLCDLVQVRNAGGCVVRLHVRGAARAV
jgi:anti-sigma regulatory factor (Ser/Thr protein kinase)